MATLGERWRNYAEAGLGQHQSREILAQCFRLKSHSPSMQPLQKCVASTKDLRVFHTDLKPHHRQAIMDRKVVTHQQLTSMDTLRLANPLRHITLEARRHCHTRIILHHNHKLIHHSRHTSLELYDHRLTARSLCLSRLPNLVHRSVTYTMALPLPRCHIKPG